MQSDAIFSGFPSAWRDYLGETELQLIETQCSRRLLDEMSYPSHSDRFRAFELCSPQQCRAVIVGQDPYHRPDQAMGLAFSVRHGVPMPPSLRNVLKEWQAEFGYPWPMSGDLSRWASNGVLLLNRVLSVRPYEAGSHRNLGWEALTNRVIEKLASDSTYRVFCLWGNDAKQLKALIPESQGMIECVHPSPLSAHRGFFGSRPFTAINRLLKANGQSELDWTLPLDLSGNFEGHINQLF